MKKILNILVLMLFVSAFAYGQYEPKGKVPKAESALNSNKLDIAKAEIDKAFEDNNKGKITTSAKNWFVRGNVYKAIFQDSAEFKDLDSEALKKAAESYNKAIEIEDKESGYYTVFAGQELNNLYAVVLDEGAQAYQDENFEVAYRNFKRALEVKPGDSTALLYAGTAAQVAEMFDEAAEMYGKMVEQGDATESIYKSLIYIYKVPKEDPETAMTYVDKAITQFPENDDFVQEKIYYLITSGKSEEAEKELKSQIAANPDEPLLHYELGYLYDETDQDEKALEAYGKAMELDPNYYEAVFNYAAIHYNRAADILKELNNIPLGNDYRKYEKLEKEYNQKAAEHFKKALPHLEKAYELRQNDVKLLEILGGVYNRLQMKEKADEIEEKLNTVSEDSTGGME